jgi:AraC-like DNA-binding protein
MTALPFGLIEPQSEALRRLCQKVRETPGDAWSSLQAAKESNMSERTLSRHFQQQTTLTWSEWVRRAKLMEALVRLAQGQSVLRVALDLGYGSHSAFSAMFRRVMGMAPSDYFRSPE